MPRNRIHKKNDGRYTYKTTSLNGERLTITSRKNETLAQFKKRCDELDTTSETYTSTQTFDELFQFWLENYIKSNNRKQEYTNCLSIYKNHILSFIGHRKLHEIKRSDVYNILSRAKEKGLSNSMIKKIRGCISRPYNWAVNSLGMQLTPPTQGLVFKYNREDDTINFLTDTEIKIFFDAAKNSKYYNYFKLMLLTGLRPSECLGLRTENITKNYLLIRQGWTIDGLTDLKNTNANRDFPLVDTTRKILHEQRIKSMKLGTHWLFPTVTGEPSMNAAKLALKRVLKQTAVYERGGRNGLKKIGLIRPPIECVLYDFRHTFATKQAENGMPINILCELMGHEDASTTMKYYIGLTDKMIEQSKIILNDWAQNF